jgi:hypothetical protein
MQPTATSSKSSSVAAMLLAILAALSLQIVRSEASLRPWVEALPTLLTVTAAIVIWRLQSRSPHWKQKLESATPIVVTAFVSMPAILGILGRQTGWGGEPMELLMLATLQNAALALSAYGGHRRCQQLAGLLSAFLVLFATAMTSQPGPLILAGVYAVVGLWWLMGSYWERLEGTFPAANTSRCVPVRTSVLGITLACVAAVAALVASAGATTYVLDGFMPTSGGNRWYDPYARAGVGDGDAMVAAKDNAMSFGPVESELFLESEMPSLYDIFNDLLGEDPKLMKQRQRAIALDPLTETREQEDTSQTQRSGREFSTVRRQADRRRQRLEDRDAPAMLYVIGRTPLHLTLETFDHFDGRDWTQSDTLERHPDLRVCQRQGKPWVTWRDVTDHPIFQQREQLAVKFINLKSPRVPTPPHMAAVHIDKLDRTDFFDWTSDGVIAMSERDAIPQLTVLHLTSFAVNLQPLRNGEAGTGRYCGLNSLLDAGSTYQDHPSVSLIQPYLDVPESLLKSRNLVDDGIEGQPRGWQQVEQVVHRLRTEFIHDPDAIAPVDCENVVEHFLNQRRGPDYLFATTAAMVLRSLDYPTRLATGFYVRPERYDRVAGQTPVLSEDAHVWVEVCVDHNTWIPIEPTPGFAEPREQLTLVQRLRKLATALGALCWHHRLWIAGLVLLVSAAVWFRRIWIDIVLWFGWWIVARGSLERQVKWTVWLLERRGRLAATRRPAHVTLSQWYARMIRAMPTNQATEMQHFLPLMEVVFYAPSDRRLNVAPDQRHRLRKTLRDIAVQWHARRMRTVYQS